LSDPSEQTLKGRVELTWTNKDERLLTEEDGSYRWIPAADFRVAEVRLLDHAATVGEVRSERRRAADNLLVRGDALHALTSLIGLPEFGEEYAAKVKLAYLDPPFNTRQSFLHYEDSLEHSVWLTMMRDRLQQIKRLLTSDGSVWVHCDDSEQARLKVLMDEMFGAENFLGTVVWEKFATRDNRTLFSTSHDYILIYAKSRQEFKRNLLPFGDAQRARYSNPDDDPRGDWASLPMHAKAGPGRRKEQFYTVTTPSGRKVDAPAGRCWTYTEDRYKELVEDGRIWFGADGGNVPRVKVFLSEVEGGLVPRTWWPKDEVGDTAAAKAEIVGLFPDQTPFSTPKPELLMQRVIEIASNPGDVVLDCFAGSGTTPAVAHKLGRRWIAVERNAETLEHFTMPRLAKVVAGEDDGGITESVEWKGGGGFRVLDIAPSMFSEEHGLVMLADWATNGKLAEVTAAQLAFEYAPDSPFCGRRGRTRLAVIDGLVSQDAARLLAGAVGEDENLILCGTAIDPGAAGVLRQLRPGSKVRKIPASILEEYRVSRWIPTSRSTPGSEPDTQAESVEAAS
jgi:adenine-specific DNA-methyltransferase